MALGQTWLGHPAWHPQIFDGDPFLHLKVRGIYIILSFDPHTAFSLMASQTSPLRGGTIHTFNSNLYRREVWAAACLEWQETRMPNRTHFWNSLGEHCSPFWVTASLLLMGFSEVTYVDSHHCCLASTDLREKWGMSMQMDQLAECGNPIRNCLAVERS